jgi:hypothetical protein
MKRRALLRELRSIQGAFDRAPLNWRYNNRAVLRNVADRAGYVLKAAARLVRLLPEIVRILEQAK